MAKMKEVTEESCDLAATGLSEVEMESFAFWVGEGEQASLLVDVAKVLEIAAN